MTDQANALRDIARKHNGFEAGLGSGTGCQVIAVTSGKGGVGKTSIVVNVSIALQKAGKKVAILDADFGLANVDVFFGLVPTHNLGHVLEGILPLKSIILEGPEGVHIIPAGSGLQELTDMADSTRDRILLELSGILNQYDFLLIDTASGISNNVVGLLAVSARVVVVSMPEPTAMLDAYALIKVLLRRNRSKEILLVINSAESDDEAQRVFSQLARVVQSFLAKQITLLGFVLKDDKVSEAVRQQVPIFLSNPRAGVSRCFTRIAASLLSSTQAEDTA